MEGHLDPLNQRCDALGDLAGRAGVELLKTDGEPDEGPENAQSRHGPGYQIQHVPVDRLVQQIMVDVVFDVALVDAVRKLIRPGDLRREILILRPENRIGEQRFPVPVGFPEVFMLLAVIRPDRLRGVLKIPHHAVDGAEASEGIEEENQNDEKHRPAHDDVGPVQPAGRHVEIDTDREHHNIGDDQRRFRSKQFFHWLLLPFTVRPDKPADKNSIPCPRLRRAYDLS